jgi:hypothetical protein
MIPKTGNKQADTAFLVIILAAVAYLVYKVTKVAGAGAGAVETAFDNINDFFEGDTSLPNPATIKIDETKLTHPREQFDIWVNQLYDALWGFIADDQTIRDIMYQVNSDDDLKLLIKLYGSQSSMFETSRGSLVTHLREIVPDDIAGFNYHFEGWNMKLRI